MVVWLKPCKSRSLLSALLLTLRRVTEGFFMSDDSFGCASTQATSTLPYSVRASESAARNVLPHVAQISFQRYVLNHYCILVRKKRGIVQYLSELIFLEDSCRFNPDRCACLLEARNNVARDERQVDSRSTLSHHRGFEWVIKAIAGKRICDRRKAHVIRTRFDAVENEPRKSLRQIIFCDLFGRCAIGIVDRTNLHERSVQIFCLRDKADGRHSRQRACRMGRNERQKICRILRIEIGKASENLDGTHCHSRSIRKRDEFRNQAALRCARKTDICRKNDRLCFTVPNDNGALGRFEDVQCICDMILIS